ncbi:uncharacterized protein VSU04_010597 isoform 1-T1 [Chlamydotis macqueenii]
MLIDCNAGMDAFQFVCDEMGPERATGSAALNLLVEGIAAFVSIFVFRRWLPSQGHRCCTPVSSSEPASSSLNEHGFREGFPRLQVCKELNQRRCGSCELQRGCRSEPRNPGMDQDGRKLVLHRCAVWYLTSTWSWEQHCADPCLP